MGTFRADDGSGRPVECAAWRMTPEIGARLAAAAASRTTQYCFDYEHQILRAATNGKPAPAAGWFKSIEVRADGVWATGIEWTPAARAMIEAGEYRYTSPLFSYDKSTGDIQSLVNVALTNTPALDGMNAVAASALAALTTTAPVPENSMDELLERLRCLFNLPLTATAEDIVGELDKVKTMLTAGDGTGTAATSVSLIASLTKLQSDLAQSRTALAAASAATGTPDPAQFVPMSEFITMQNQVAALSHQLESGERAELMEAALNDGRIMLAQKDYWAKQPIAALRAYLEVAQPIAALTGTQTGGRAPNGAGLAALTADQAKIARALGIDEAEFAKSLSQGA
ncbi:MAG: phage protease [Burkholderia sp.]